MVPAREREVVPLRLDNMCSCAAHALERSSSPLVYAYNALLTRTDPKGRWDRGNPILQSLVTPPPLELSGDIPASTKFTVGFVQEKGIASPSSGTIPSLPEGESSGKLAKELRRSILTGPAES